MLFPTWTFVAFLAAVFAISWALAGHPRAWKSFMRTREATGRLKR